MKNGFWKVFFYEFKLLFGSPKKLFLALGVPVLLFFFFGLMFQEEPRDYKVGIIDYDQSMLSGKLIRNLDATPEISIAQVLQTEEQAKRLLQRGEIYGFIVVPNNLEKDVLRGQQTDVFCYTNGQYLLPSGNISKAFKITTKMISAGVNIEKRKKKGQEYSSALADAQPIRLDVHTIYNPYINYGYYLTTPFLPFMLELVVIILSIYVIATPLKYGFADSWLRMSGNNPWAALWGKLLPYTIVFCFVGWWMNFYLFKIMGTPLHVTMTSVVLMTFLLIIVHQVLGVFFVSISKDMRSALTFGAGFSAICFSFAAYTFPIEGLPRFIQDISNIFPFTHFLKYYINRAIKGIPMDYTIHNLYSFGAYFILFLLTFPLFVKKLKKGSYE